MICMQELYVNNHPVQYMGLLMQQRPWYSVTRMPPEVMARSQQGKDPASSSRPATMEIRNHGVDVLISMIRMLLVFCFETKPEHQNSVLIKVTNHNFGWDHQSDIEQNGRLLAELYPDWDAERFCREHVPFASLLGHERVQEILFGQESFSLVVSHKLAFSSPAAKEPSGHVELPRDEVVSASKLVWDGEQELSS